MELRRSIRRFSRYGVELLVVFVGVWLSLLAESWRQKRIDSRAEKESINRLIQDIGFDIRDMHGNLQRAMAGLTSARWILDRTTLASAPLDSLPRIMSPLRSCSLLIENASEYTALKSSGRLGLLRDAKLRQRVVELYESRSFLKWIHDQDCRVSTAVFESITPFVVFREPLPDDQLDRLNPRIAAIEEPARLFADATSRNRLIELASIRGSLSRQIEAAIREAETLRADLVQIR